MSRIEDEPSGFFGRLDARFASWLDKKTASWIKDPKQEVVDYPKRKLVRTLGVSAAVVAVGGSGALVWATQNKPNESQPTRPTPPKAKELPRRFDTKPVRPAGFVEARLGDEERLLRPGELVIIDRHVFYNGVGGLNLLISVGALNQFKKYLEINGLKDDSVRIFAILPSSSDPVKLSQQGEIFDKTRFKDLRENNPWDNPRFILHIVPGFKLLHNAYASFREKNRKELSYGYVAIDTTELFAQTGMSKPVDLEATRVNSGKYDKYLLSPLDIEDSTIDLAIDEEKRAMAKEAAVLLVPERVLPLSPFTHIPFDGGIFYNDHPNLFINISVARFEEIFNRVSGMKPADGKKIAIVFTESGTRSVIASINAQSALVSAYNGKVDSHVVIIPVDTLISDTLKRMPGMSIQNAYLDLEKTLDVAILTGVREAQRDPSRPRQGLTENESDLVDARNITQIIQIQQRKSILP